MYWKKNLGRCLGKAAVQNKKKKFAVMSMDSTTSGPCNTEVASYLLYSIM